MSLKNFCWSQESCVCTTFCTKLESLFQTHTCALSSSSSSCRRMHELERVRVFAGGVSGFMFLLAVEGSIRSTLLGKFLQSPLSRVRFCTVTPYMKIKRDVWIVRVFACEIAGKRVSLQNIWGKNEHTESFAAIYSNDFSSDKKFLSVRKMRPGTFWPC